MVLDVKAMKWAAEKDVDTAKLKAASVRIYGKWYFPDIPPGVPLVNLDTGERETFAQPHIAGETVWIAEADLQRLGVLPASEVAEEQATHTVEPLLAMSRLPLPPRQTLTPAHEPERLLDAEPAPPGIQVPPPSLAPFLIAVGVALVTLGMLTHPSVLLVGLAWLAVGAYRWMREGEVVALRG